MYRRIALGITGLWAACAPPAVETPTQPTWDWIVQTPQISAKAGETVDIAIQLVPQHGFSGHVALSVEGFPAGVTTAPSSVHVALNPTTVSLKLSLAAGLAAGQYAGQVTASSTEIRKTADLVLNVVEIRPEPQKQDFRLSLSPPAINLTPGKSAEVAVTVERLSGFNSPIALTLADAPNGVTLSPTTIAADATRATATLFASSDAVPAEATTAQLIAKGGGIEHVASLTVTVEEAKPSGLDLSFGTGGLVRTIITEADWYGARLVRVHPDGKILLVGNNEGANFPLQGFFIQTLSNGQMDPSFNSGKVMMDRTFYDVSDVVLLPNGRFLAAGSGDEGGTMVLYRADGTMDPAFGTNGVTTLHLPSDPDKSMAFRRAKSLGDGRILVAGTIGDISDQRTFVARYSADGVFDATFGSSNPGFFNGFVSDTAHFFDSAVFQADGKILLFCLQWDEEDVVVIRLTADGQLDTTYGANGVVKFGKPNVLEIPDGAELMPDGSTVLKVSGGSDYLMRIRPDGSQDMGFGTAGVLDLASRSASGMTATSDGTLYVSRMVPLNNTKACANLVRISPSGTVDTGWGNSSTSTGHTVCDPSGSFRTDFALALSPSGEIVFGAAYLEQSSPPTEAALLRFLP